MLTCKTVPANTDVVGKGIRINFYFTTFLLSLIPQTPYTVGLLNALYTNAGISGFGLLLTAIIQTAQNQLSLFHAICVLHILYFLGISSSPMGKYHWTRGRVIMGVFLQFASVIAYTGWAMYVWVHVKTYGSHPECNDHIKYVIMFVTVRATVPWLHRLWMAVLIISSVMLMVGFVQATVLFVALRDTEREWADVDSEMEMEVDTGTCHISTGPLFSAIYATVTLELTMHRNKAKLLPDGTNVGRGVIEVDDSWQFGQVLSVVMIIANVNEIVRFIYRIISYYRRY